MRLEGYAHISFEWEVNTASAVSDSERWEGSIQSEPCSLLCSWRLQQKEKLFKMVFYNFQSCTRL